MSAPVEVVAALLKNGKGISDGSVLSVEKQSSRAAPGFDQSLIML